MQVYVLKCSIAEHQQFIDHFVDLANKEIEHFVEPIPWKHFVCKDDKVVFVATKNNELVGWALCYKDVQLNTLYLSAISTKAAKNPANYRGVGTTIMNTIVNFGEAEHLRYIYLLPLQETHGFYKRFGFTSFDADVFLFKPISEAPSKTEILWYNSQDDLSLMVTELEDEVSKSKRKILHKMISISFAVNHPEVFEELVEHVQDEDYEGVLSLIRNDYA